MQFSDVPHGTLISASNDTYIKIAAGYNVILRYEDRDDSINAVSILDGSPAAFLPDDEVEEISREATAAATMGRAKSERKAAAARENGRKSKGRPKKTE